MLTSRNATAVRIGHFADMMKSYTCRFLNHGGHVYGEACFQAADDAAAVALARRQYATGIGNGYVVYEGDRLVGREPGPQAARAASRHIGNDPALSN